MTEKLLAEYDSKSVLYTEFCRSLEGHLKNVIDPEIAIHSITNRIKERESLSKKIVRKNLKYKVLGDITDIAGIRIITYLDSDVTKIGRLIEKHYNLDLENCVNKGEIEFDRFGYKSLHYVLGYNSENLTLPGLKRFKGLKLEIQIRTILQHAWAELEHDLGYKHEISIPEKLKRSFTRLAALLETADIEFDRLKDQIMKYSEELSDRIKSEPNEIEINRDSLNSFLKADSTMVNVLSILSDRFRIDFDPNFDLTFVIIKFKYFGILNIGQIQQSVYNNSEHFIKFSDSYIKLFLHNQRVVNYYMLLWLFTHFLASSRD